MKIPLTQGVFAEVDAEDSWLVFGCKWSALQCGGVFYAAWVERCGPRSQNKTQTILMHRHIMQAKRGVVVDHINGNTLDNRRSNLRLATTTENLRNRGSYRGTSMFKGVFWDKQTSKWQAGIVVNRKRVYLGRFDDEKEAARAYDCAAASMFGEFARTNFGGV